ncbi:MAG TPA: hypothetical protein VLI93_08060, partial [Acetobacteraceae bacterium]|nr:hypothetical protein [Acetobacteraceae bacterium]
MSGLIYLMAMAGVGWLVFWTIRDPKEPKWDWWPIEWWPFDTHDEEAAEFTKPDVKPEAGIPSHKHAMPWHNRRTEDWRQRRRTAAQHRR